MNRLSAAVEQLIRQKMSSGKYGSEEELLIDALESLHTDDGDDELAIQESLDDLTRGEQGAPLNEALAKIRADFGIESDS